MPENLNNFPLEYFAPRADAADPFHPSNMPVSNGNADKHPSLTGRDSQGSPVRNPDEHHLDDIVLGIQSQSTKTLEQEHNPPPVKWEPDVLRPRHREILRRILEGATYVEIAEAMGIHKQTVMLIATSPLFKAELSKLESRLDFHVVQRATQWPTKL